jgi:hypothetical protein
MKTSPKKALARLVLVFLRGDNYETMNPYIRPEIQEALDALGLQHRSGYPSGADKKREVSVENLERIAKRRA